MKTVLFINGCVRGKHSRTLRLAETYLEKLQKEDAVQVVERNLMEENLTYITSQAFDPQTGEQYPREDRLAKEFASADAIVLAAPFWEFLFPAMVSCYIENISLVGTAFQYTAKGSEGLCKAQSFTYIYTAGDYLKPEDKICEKYLQSLTKLFGIPTFSSIVVDGLDIQTNDAEKLVSEMCDKIKKG